MAVERTRTVSLVRDWLNYLGVSKALAPAAVALYRRLCSSFVVVQKPTNSNPSCYGSFGRAFPTPAERARRLCLLRGQPQSLSDGVVWLVSVPNVQGVVYVTSGSGVAGRLIG
jgi:hypothetical protein